MIYTIIRGDTTTITLDCVQQFSESHSATVVQHPVETGSAITDHVFLNNTELSLKGVVSDFSPSPAYITMAGLGSEDAGQASGSHTAEIKELLMSIFRSREVVTIQVSAEPPKLLVNAQLSDFSTLNQFDNCVLTSIGFSDDPEAGEAIYPDLRFSQIRVVNKETRKEAAVPDVLFAVTQDGSRDPKAEADAAAKTKAAEAAEAAEASKMSPAQLADLKQTALNNLGARTLDLNSRYPNLTTKEIREIQRVESKQTITEDGRITAGWTKESFTGRPRPDIGKVAAKEERDTAQAVVDSLNKQVAAERNTQYTSPSNTNLLFGRMGIPQGVPPK